MNMLLERHSPKWVDDFKAIQGVIDTALNGLTYHIEHVGSTAVPGLDAKPIIDIDIIHVHRSDFQRIRAGLEKLGYYHNGDQGVEDREVFKRNGTMKHEVLDRIRHHLYVCPVDSKALERHLLTRDHFRQNEWAMKKYQKMKYELAEMAGHDSKVYAALKELHVNEFLDTIVEAERNDRNSTRKL